MHNNIHRIKLYHFPEPTHTECTVPVSATTVHSTDDIKVRGGRIRLTLATVVDVIQRQKKLIPLPRGASFRAKKIALSWRLNYGGAYALEKMGVV